MRRWINGHIGLPVPVAEVVTGETLHALRQYFLGVTIVAAFNAMVIGLGALILGVPLAGTIAVVTFVGAYVPFIGAWVGGAFAVALALAGQGETAAIVMAVIVLLANGMLQQIVQPIAFGATLEPQPARGADRDDQRRVPVRDDRPDPRRAARLGGGAHRPPAGR